MANNYLVCRIENYKMQQAIGVDWEKEHLEERGYNNPDWDKSKRDENISLEHDTNKDGKTLPQYIKDFREEHNIQGRMTTSGKEKSQTNVLTQCIITTSPEYMNTLDKQEQISFFKDGLKSFKEMYPTYHVVDAVIHYDEKTPHMHINCLPLYHNQEKDIWQFSTTKTQEGRYHYRDFQNHMYDRLSRIYNIERGVPKDEKTHLTNKEWYELNKKEKELLERERQLQEREQAIKKYEERPSPKKAIFTKKEKYDTKDVNELVDERNILYTQLEKVKQENKDLQQSVSWIQFKYNELDKNFTQEHEEFLRLKDKQHDKDYLKQQLREEEHPHKHEHNHERELTIGGR